MWAVGSPSLHLALALALFLRVSRLVFVSLQFVPLSRPLPSPSLPRSLTPSSLCLCLSALSRRMALSLLAWTEAISIAFTARWDAFQLRQGWFAERTLAFF